MTDNKSVESKKYQSHVFTLYTQVSTFELIQFQTSSNEEYLSLKKELIEKKDNVLVNKTETLTIIIKVKSTAKVDYLFVSTVDWIFLPRARLVMVAYENWSSK